MRSFEKGDLLEMATSCGDGGVVSEYPGQMGGTPVPLGLKTECSDRDEELTDGVSRMN
jgi:hypothetical protein